MKNKALKFLLVCILCVAIVSGIVLLIQYLTN